MSKDTPYPQKRQPAKRISLKKHESIVNVLEQRIKHIEHKYYMVSERLEVANGKLDAMRSVNSRERAIVNALVGHNE